MTARHHAIALFEETFRRSPDGVVRSPGRVNLIGDHTDYNGGLALPMAIEPATWVAFAASAGTDVAVVSSVEPEPARYAVSADAPVGGWGNYVQGTTRAMGLTQGFDAAIASDLTIGAGLSSSASLELAVARVVTEIFGAEWDPMAAALAGQRAENEWVGVSTGLLDQISVSHAEAGSALLIDFATLDVATVAIPAGVTVFVLDGGGNRSLATSQYGERRKTCERAAARLGISSLREITVGELHTLDLPELEMKRVRHVVTENARVNATVEAFGSNDAAAAGRIMVESHTSLRDDYEVAGVLQDAIVAAALDAPGVFGARMTGGGFAGSAVALVDENQTAAFAAAVDEAYRSPQGDPATVYASQPAPAVSVEHLSQSRLIGAGAMSE